MADKSRFSKFEGKPLIKLLEIIPTAGFLDGNFGKDVLKEYQGRVKRDYAKAPVLNVLDYEDGVVKGSNPFAVVLVGSIVGQDGLRVATQADLERAIKCDALPLRGQYEDTGLVLRSEGEPNSYLARHLMQQIRARNSKAEMPSVIPLSGLELVTDQNSPHGLAFKLKDNAAITYGASVLSKDGAFTSEDVDETIGLPTKIGQGDRNLYTRNSGLSRLYLCRSLDLDSRYDNLALSNGLGRVVVVSAEGTSQKIAGYLAQLEAERAEQKAEIDRRFAKASNLLLGK